MHDRSEGVIVIYLVLCGPFVALPALLVLERYEAWATRHRGGSHPSS